MTFQEIFVFPTKPWLGFEFVKPWANSRKQRMFDKQNFIVDANNTRVIGGIDLMLSNCSELSLVGETSSWRIIEGQLNE